MNDVITKEHVFEHGIDKVWNAISNGEEISTWFLKANFKPEVGFKYTFESGEEDECARIRGVVKSADPYTLVYTWIVENTDVETLVSWSLETHENQTKLILEHSGISNYRGESAVKFFESFDNGWNNCVSGLIDYLKAEVHV